MQKCPRQNNSGQLAPKRSTKHPGRKRHLRVRPCLLAEKSPVPKVPSPVCSPRKTEYGHLTRENVPVEERSGNTFLRHKNCPRLIMLDFPSAKTCRGTPAEPKDPVRLAWVATIKSCCQNGPLLLHELVQQELLGNRREWDHVDAVDEFNLVAEPAACDQQRSDRHPSARHFRARATQATEPQHGVALMPKPRA